MKKIILTDLYNTLARNTTRLHPFKNLYTRLSQINNIPDYRGFFNKAMTENKDIRYLLEMYDYDDEWIDEFEEKIDLEMKSVIYNDELIEMMNTSGSEIILISNLSKQYYPPVEELKKRLNFSDIILSYEVGMIKPNGDIFELALSKVKSQESLDTTMYGDNTKLDIEPAKKMGLKTKLIEKWW